MMNKLLTKTCYALSDILIRRANMDKMMSYHLRLKPYHTSAITLLRTH